VSGPGRGRVVAVVVGAHAAEATLAAVRGQTCPVEPRQAMGLAEALALADGAEWLWLLGPQVVPEPDALERLLAAARDPGDLPSAPLHCSLPVDERGEVSEAALPRGDEAGTEGLLAAVGRRLVPVKRAPLTSLLVDASAVRAAAPPEPGRYGPFTAQAWTGGLLAAAPGYLVLASRVHTPAPARLPLGALAAVARMRRARLMTRGEGLRAVARAVSRDR
jgi:hypothetical protein